MRSRRARQSVVCSQRHNTGAFQTFPCVFVERVLRVPESTQKDTKVQRSTSDTTQVILPFRFSSFWGLLTFLENVAYYFDFGLDWMYCYAVRHSISDFPIPVVLFVQSFPTRECETHKYSDQNKQKDLFWMIKYPILIYNQGIMICKQKVVET